MRRKLLLLALAVLGADVANAHPRATSHSSWEIRSTLPVEARVLARVPWSELRAVRPELARATPEQLEVRPDLAEVVDLYLAERIALYAGSTRCLAMGVPLPVASADPTHFARRWRVRCPEEGPLELRIDAFQEVNVTHLHIARARLDALPVVERVFVMGSAGWPLVASGEASGPAAAASSWSEYLVLGIEHIATGYDHIVFVLALLLMGTSLAQLASVVTGFTLAHSITLTLGVLGVIQPLPSAVEALIGLSIVVVALENFSLTVSATTSRWVFGLLCGLLLAATLGAVFGAVGIPALALAGISLFSLCYFGLLPRVERPQRLRWFVALVFGLVHGFGFAGVLAEVGLPASRVAPALLGFNLGVEVGQLIFVAVGFALVSAFVAWRPTQRPRMVQWASTPVLAAGLFWFLSRALG